MSVARRHVWPHGPSVRPVRMGNRQREGRGPRNNEKTPGTARGRAKPARKSLGETPCATGIAGRAPHRQKQAPFLIELIQLIQLIRLIRFIRLTP